MTADAAGTADLIAHLSPSMRHWMTTGAVGTENSFWVFAGLRINAALERRGLIDPQGRMTSIGLVVRDELLKAPAP